MEMYPAYKAVDVMDEYAITFFALLNEGYRIRYENALLAAQIADLPYLKPEDRKSFYRQIEWASQHPGDILKPSGQGSDPAEIKKLLGGK
jgi:hypothetical protein